MNESIVKMIDASGTEYVVVPGNTKVEVETVGDQNYMIAIFHPNTNEGIKLDKIKWRAEKGETYYSVDQGSGMFEVYRHIESGDFIDDEFHESNNYFKTRGEAEKILDKIFDIFK